VINNSLFYINLSLCFMFTPWYDDSVHYETLGNIFNGIFYLMCGSNILFQFIEMGRSLYKKYRAYKIKKRNENIIKQRLLAKQKLKDE
jgi:hypothetical protein